MEHFGNFIQSGLLGALDWFGQQEPETQLLHINMGGPRPSVSYTSGNSYEIRNGNFQSPQALPGTFTPAIPNAVWNPGAGMANPASSPAIWNTAQQGAYPIQRVSAQEERGQEADIPYYMIGRRHLRGAELFYPVMPEAQEDVNSRFEHHHLWRNDGTNFGLTTSGKFSEHGGRENYSFDVPGHDATRYKAKYIEQAEKELDREWEEVERILRGTKENFPMSDDVDDEMPRYHAFRYNCQDYVDSIIERAWKKARMNNDSLVF